MIKPSAHCLIFVVGRAENCATGHDKDAGICASIARQLRSGVTVLVRQRTSLFGRGVLNILYFSGLVNRTLPLESCNRTME